jgi:hypothetical protein
MTNATVLMPDRMHYHSCQVNSGPEGPLFIVATGRP